MFNLNSKFDAQSNDALEFRKLAEHILGLVHDSAVKTNGNKHILCFIAAGLVDAAESMQEYVSKEVEKN